MPRVTQPIPCRFARTREFTAVPMRRELSIEILAAGDGNRSVGTIRDQILPLAKHANLLAVCAITLIGLIAALGFALVRPVPSDGVALFAQMGG